MDALPALRRREEQESEDSGSCYGIIIPRDMRKELEGRGAASRAVQAGYRKGITSYRKFFEVLARLSRWISETSYEWSFVFVILAIAGGMANGHAITMFSLSAIVLLNLVGLVGGLVTLVMLAFRESLVQGLLCLIPPWTAIYLWKNRTRYQKTVNRITSPLLILCLVVLAYAFIPWLNGNQPAPATLEGRIKKAVESVEHNVGESASEIVEKAEAVQDKLPGQVDKAKAKLGEIEDKAKTRLDQWKDKDKTPAQGSATDGINPGDPEKPAQNRSP
jgi:hypothetical protein